MNVLVIDVGTSSMRGILFCESGKELDKCQISYREAYSKAGLVEQGGEVFEQTLKTIVAKIVSNSGSHEIQAIAVTAQRSSVMPVDRNGKGLMPFIMWQDTRNTELCEELAAHNESIAAISGAKINTVFSGGKMAWIRREHPEIYEKTYKLINIPEYLLYVMTGEFCIDYTYGSRSNLMNLKEKRWDEQLLKLFGIDKEKLNRLVSPGTIAGGVNARFAGETGVKAGIPVITSGGDQQCASVGIGAYRNGDMSVVTGSGGYVTLISSEIPEQLNPNLICNCSAIDGKYSIEASVLNCCTAFNWFCRNFYEGMDYEQINQILEDRYEKEDGVLCLPYFQGRGTPKWNGNARAAFCNINLSMEKHDFLKSLLEGIFLEIKSNIELLEAYAAVNHVYISGGLTKSNIMNQMQADVYGRKLCLSDESESTAYGALAVALKSLGVYASEEEGLEILLKRTGNTYYFPDEEKAQKYLKKQEQMNQMYQKIF